MKTSLISGDSQPITKLKIKGDVNNGVCSSRLQVYFKNKKEKDTIEISFSFPLPFGVSATHFNVKYNDETVESSISNSEDAKLEYDDAIASSDFAAIVKNTEGNELRIDLGPLAPSETCKLTLFYDVPLQPLSNGFLLILPTSINNVGKTSVLGLDPPPVKLKINVKDYREISSITTPFTETKIDLVNGLITSENLSLFHPLHVVVRYKGESMVNMNSLLYQRKNNDLFIRTTISSPLLERKVPVKYTILIEQTPERTSGELSVLLRALEFFVLSVPIGSYFNISNYGSKQNSLFPKPQLLNTENRKKALEFVRNPTKEESSAASFADVYGTLIYNNMKETDSIESFVIIIGSPIEDDVILSHNHTHFMLDPFSGGDLALTARKKNSIYLPVPDESSLISSVLSIIKMTGCNLYKNVSIEFPDGENVVLPQILPGYIFSFTNCFIGKKDQKIDHVRIHFDNMYVDLSVKESSLPILDKIWALETIYNNFKNPDELDENERNELNLANKILSPDLPLVAVVEREDEIQGDLIHIETKMGAAGLQWVERHLFDNDNQQQPQPHPHPIPVPLPHPIPVPFPHPHPFPIPMPRPMPLPHPFIIRKIRNPSLLETLENPNKPDPQLASLHANSGNDFMAPLEEDVEIEHIDIIKHIKTNEEKMRLVKPKEIPKKPFFLLRLLQLQNADGSWSEENSMRICCGFNIPSESEQIVPLKRVEFITVFAISCLRAKAINDEEKWILVVQNAIHFLKSQNSSCNWEEIIEKVQMNLK